MINIHLLVEEDYIEELMMSLPIDKVRVVEKEFEENKILLASTLEEYKKNSDSFVSYSKSIETMSSWLEGKQI